MTSKVYGNKPETLKELKQIIREEINEISRKISGKIIKNVLKLGRIYEANRGRYLSDIAFQA